MHFEIVEGSVTEQTCDALVIGKSASDAYDASAYDAIDKALDGKLSEMLADTQFKPESGSLAMVNTLGRIPAKNVIVAGMDDKANTRAHALLKSSATAARRCKEMGCKRVVLVMRSFRLSTDTECIGKLMTQGAVLGAYEHTRLKTENAKPNPIESFALLIPDSSRSERVRGCISDGESVGNAICFARDLDNEPSNVVTPEYLAETARKIASEYGMAITVLGRAEIQEQGMGLLYAVSRGSAVEPRFIRLDYRHPEATKTIALVGKGITFDTGGYCLKPADGMYGMKDDMAGAGAVLAAMDFAGKTKPKLNVIGLVPVTENDIGGSAVHPGDVFAAYDGKTVEIQNTDAEGRLVVSDAVAYARKLGVDEIVDLATLTGACVVALGSSIAGLFSNNDDLAGRLEAAGSASGEKLWRLPLEKDYNKDIESTIADVKNVGGRQAGAIVGALFIEKFAGETPWAHIDLSFAGAENDTGISRKGCTGAGTGTLVEYLASHGAAGGTT